jgi:hypothetical protein
MKIYILHSLSMKMDRMKTKNKHEEEENELVFYCPKFTKTHPRNEFPLELIDVCGICEENQPTNKCPSFLGLKDTFQGEEENIESL